MSSFNSEIFASINIRRTQKKRYGIVQDNCIINHSVELEEGDGFQQADAVFYTSVTHGVSGNVDHDLESIPFSIVGHDTDQNFIGPNGTNIKAYSFYNRSANRLYFKMPFQSDYLAVNPSSEVHCSNMDGWRVYSASNVSVSGSSGSAYDLFILGNYVLIEITGNFNVNYEHKANFSSNYVLNYEAAGNIANTGLISVEHGLPVSKSGEIPYEYGVYHSVTQQLKTENLVEVSKVDAVTYEFNGYAATITSTNTLGIEHLLEVGISGEIDTENLLEVISSGELDTENNANTDGDGGILFGFWF